MMIILTIVIAVTCNGRHVESQTSFRGLWSDFREIVELVGAARHYDMMISS